MNRSEHDFETRTNAQEARADTIASAGTELLILFDGRILVHNLTPRMKALLQEVLNAHAQAGVAGSLPQPDLSAPDPQSTL